MSQVKLEGSFESFHGKLGKKSNIVFRKKKAQVSTKRDVYNSPQEAYVVELPRDWKKNPPKGAELEKINRFREACRLTSEQLNNPETRPIWEERFHEQLKHVEYTIPGDPTSEKRQVYTHLWAHTRATILLQLKQQAIQKANPDSDQQQS